MGICPHCHAEIPAGHSCPTCEDALETSARATLIKASEPSEVSGPKKPKLIISDSAGGSASFDSIDGARFVPGALILDRYRIVGLLGKGGMGEVYRADDLKLGQAVALKFLPERLSSDGAAMAQLHREVRIARQVSHPNVCRVFDIGEAEGLQFLSMEYIDGEDIESLLRRIGRLPDDKATQIGRELCFGIAAAHDGGILHRDLKPANVMIDGRGRARITDFGLAVLSQQLRQNDEIAGTPAYMAPEQLTGGEVTTKSDIYALGLILYELYTGKHAFQAATVAEYIKHHTESTPSDPSSFVSGLDPLVERVILRCLEKDPANRPQSAIQVASALPGGDPLQMALAAGETPSPEMVAAAGEKKGLRPPVAAALLIGIIGILITTIVLGSRINILNIIRFDQSPDLLIHRAREVTAQLGYPERPVDTAYGMHYDSAYLNQLDASELSFEQRKEQLTHSRPIPVHFWYRESPDYLQSAQINARSGEVAQQDPPVDTPGMTGLELDSQGNLRSFYAVAPAIEDAQTTAEETNWNAVLALAGLDAAQLRPTESTWIPRNAYDKRMAWTGTYPNQPEPEIRVEAAARRGKVVSFDVAEPWIHPEGLQATSGQKANSMFIVAVFSLIVIGAALLARRNLRNGKGDRRGALRLAGFVGVAWILGWTLNADHVPNAGEGAIFSQATATALFYGGVVWLLYIALEPLVRRRWPTAIISWSRVLDGNVRDPLVGTDLLIGVLAGSCMVLLDLVQQFVSGNVIPSLTNLTSLLGVRQFAGWLSASFTFFLLVPLIGFFIIFILRALLRREWMVAVLFLLIALIPGALFGLPIIQIFINALFFLGIFFTAIRFGLLTLAVSFWVTQILVQPFTTDLSAWYAPSSYGVVIVVLALAIYAFRVSLGGQRVFGEGILTD